jgi:hypothetical protein
MRPDRTKNGSQEPVLVWFGFGFFRFRELDFKTLDMNRWTDMNRWIDVNRWTDVKG